MKSNPSNLLKIKFLILIFFVFGQIGLNAQYILNPYPCNTGNALPNACNGATYNVTLQFVGTTATGWTVITGPGLPDLGLGFNDPAHPTQLSGLLNNGFTGVQPVHVTATIDGVLRQGNFTLLIDPTCSSPITAGPCIWDIAFVLDRSGSMNYESPSRWNRVLQIFSSSPGANYIQTMASTAGLGSDDRWGLFFFGGNQVQHTPASHTGNFGSTLSTATWPSPLGNTPMGAGLQSSLMNFFNDATTPIGLNTPKGLGKGRAVMLLTDGDQNQNPRVSVTPAPGGSGYNFEIHEDLVSPNWSHDPAILGAGSGLGQLPITDERFALNDIHLYSVGIGTGIHAATGADLDHMSEEFVNSQNAANMTLFFNTTIPRIFKGHSPRILNIFRDTMPIVNHYQTRQVSAYHGQSFVVNGGVKNLTIQFVATDQAGFTAATVVLQKDGVTIPFVPKVNNQRAILLDLDFPYSRGDSVLVSDPKGTWTILYGDMLPIPCMITVFADDKQAKPLLNFDGKKAFATNDDLPVRLELVAGGVPVTTAKVVARLVRPQEDLGDFVSNIQVPKDSLSQALNQDSSSLGQAKINAVAAQAGYRAALERETEHEILLTHIGNGVFTGTFPGSQNSVVGGYRVIARFEGSLPSGEPFEGWELEGAYFDFAHPDDITLHEQLIATNKLDDPYILQITPTNRFNRRLGPAQERRIYVKLSQGSVGKIVDNLDGSYSIPLNVPAGANPTVTVGVIDPNTPILEKCLRCFNRSFALSAHAGATLPFSKLDSLYNSGFYAEIDLAYQLRQLYSLELVGGYYGFQSGFSIVGASLFGAYTNPDLFGPGWGARAAAGLGVFKPKNLDTTWGYGLRASLTKTINSHWEGDVDLNFFSLPDPKFAFGTIGLGVHYWF